MKKSDSTIFDDLSKLAKGAGRAASGMRKEAAPLIQARVHEIVKELDLVSRKEFDALRDRLAQTQAENEKLAAALEKLQKQLKNKAQK